MPAYLRRIGIAPWMAFAVALGAQAMDLTSPVEGEAKDLVRVAVFDPAAPAARGFEDGALTYETVLYREWRDLLERSRIRTDKTVGGPTMIGMSIGGPGDLNRDTTDELAKPRLEHWDGHGAAVLAVYPETPAAAAELEPGDVIVRFAGVWIDSTDTLIRMTSRAQPNDEYDLWVMREGLVHRTWLRPVLRSDVRDPNAVEGRPFYALGTIGLQPPQLLDGPVPDYPETLHGRLVAATLGFRVIVGDDGTVTEAVPTGERGQAPNVLVRAAREALLERTYEPGQLAGQPVPVLLPIVVDFHPGPEDAEDLTRRVRAYLDTQKPSSRNNW